MTHKTRKSHSSSQFSAESSTTCRKHHRKILQDNYCYYNVDDNYVDSSMSHSLNESNGDELEQLGNQNCNYDIDDAYNFQFESMTNASNDPKTLLRSSDSSARSF